MESGYDLIKIYDLSISEANSAAQESDDPGNEWKGGGERSATSRILSSANLPMQNAGKVKFDPPKVPVIFVLGTCSHDFNRIAINFKYINLGGPGSGKVTHCDTLMQEKKGVVHINMMDLLQQYAIGNGKLILFKRLLFDAS